MLFTLELVSGWRRKYCYDRIQRRSIKVPPGTEVLPEPVSGERGHWGCGGDKTAIALVKSVSGKGVDVS